MIKVEFINPLEISQHYHVAKCNFIECFRTEVVSIFTYFYFSETDTKDYDFVRTEFIKSIDGKEIPKRPDPSPVVLQNDGYGDTPFKANLLLVMVILCVCSFVFVCGFWLGLKLS